MPGLVSNSFGELSSSCSLLGTCKLARTSLDTPVHHRLLLTPAATLSPKPVRGWGHHPGILLVLGRERSNCVRRSPTPLAHVPELTLEQQVNLRENTPAWLTAQLLASVCIHRCTEFLPVPVEVLYEELATYLTLSLSTFTGKNIFTFSEGMYSTPRVQAVSQVSVRKGLLFFHN